MDHARKMQKVLAYTKRRAQFSTSHLVITADRDKTSGNGLPALTVVLYTP